jgi:CRP/FNR family transcriptional regulator, cyclic AMP receptor protein
MPQGRETLAQMPLLRSLDADAIQALGARCTWRTAAPKEWIIEHDDEGTDVFFLVSGSVRVLIMTSPDREVILTDIQAGGFFGELAAIDGKARSAGIVALTTANLACMPAAVFRDVFRAYPDVGEQLLQRLALRLREATQRIHEFNALQVKHRIHAELLRLSRSNPDDRRQALVSPPPSHAEIAARVSTRREMVARELKALERSGLLERRRGGLVIADVDALMAQLKVEYGLP